MKIHLLPVSLLCIFFNPGLRAQVSTPDTTQADETKIFEKVEVEASYPGGSEAWIKFLGNTVNGHTPVENGAHAGKYTVLIQFIVDKNGSLSEFKPLTQNGFGMEQEVIRVLKLSGKWDPAIQDGHPVKAYRKQPVTFQVELDGMEITTEKPFTLFTRTDNPVTIKADKVRPQDLQVTVSQGSITSLGDGNYKVKVSKTGRVVIRLYNLKKNREIGSFSIQVEEPE